MRPDVALIVSAGAAVAFVVYRLMVDPGSRRPQFQGGHAFRPRTARVAAAAVFGVFVLIAWMNTRLVP